MSDVDTLVVNSHLQFMIFPIRLTAVLVETERVRNSRVIEGFADGGIQTIAVFEGASPRFIGNRQHVAGTVRRDHRRWLQPTGISPAFRCCLHLSRGDQPSRVNGIYGDIRIAQYARCGEGKFAG